jgi:hypothetical protein
MRPSLLPSLLALAALLAGCSGGDPSPAGDPEGPAEAGLPREFSFEGCDGFMLVPQVPSQPVHDELPDGYTAEDFPAAGGINSVQLMAVACQGITVGNQSSGPLSLAWVAVQLASANGQESAFGSDHYVLEVFAPCQQAPAWCSILRRDGWPVEEATVTLQGQTVQVQAANGTSYSTEATLEDPEPTVPDPYVEGSRAHHATPQTVAFWEFDGPDISGMVGAGALRCSGGAWSRIAQCATAPVPGLLQHASLDGTVRLQVAGPAPDGTP